MYIIRTPLNKVFIRVSVTTLLVFNLFFFCSYSKTKYFYFFYWIQSERVQLWTLCSNFSCIFLHGFWTSGKLPHAFRSCPITYSVFVLAFQSPLIVTQLGFPAAPYFSLHISFVEWLRRCSPLLYAASLRLVGFGNQRK